MMLQVLHKILSVFLAVIVLFSTLSFSIEKHICMGKITDTSFFTEVSSCEMMVVECDTDDFSGNNIQKKSCCDNIQELIPGNQNEQQALQSFKIDQAQFVVAYFYTYQNLFEERKDIIPFKYYSPPLVDKDINVLYQTFLI